MEAALNDSADAAAALGDVLRARGATMATAESCTGGLIAAACTALAGSSAWFERGFVTYSNAAKTDLLGVDPELIVEHGAVSEAVVRAMADGALERSPATCAVAVTGIAGPGGGTPDKPVGTVWVGVAVRGRSTAAERLQFAGDRPAVREATVHHACRALATAVAALPRAAVAASPAVAMAPAAGRPKEPEGSTSKEPAGGRVGKGDVGG